MCKFVPCNDSKQMTMEDLLIDFTTKAIELIYGQVVSRDTVAIQKTRKEFEGDFTIVVFPFTKFSRKSPEQTAEDIGKYLKSMVKQIHSYNIIKGFLNLSLKNSYWVEFLKEVTAIEDYGYIKIDSTSPVVIEYSSPNTNKPLHLGHIRNNLLGWSIAEILKANGKNVIKVNLVNDRGIHICKSMLAWKLFGNGEEPSEKIKGDKLVGKYYVTFDKVYKEEVKNLISNGSSDEEAAKNAPLIKKAQELLLKWESGDPETIALWKKMNSWVYEGFDLTYKKLGIDFDKIYYESETYLLGKRLVVEGVKNKTFTQKEDGSVWVDLTNDGLDEKLLLRSDGTSVYMTQDIGTAQLRHDDYQAEKLIYVVGNEQNYHFDVLKLVLMKLGRTWADHIFHLSYGMVELPEGKMKSREGTVVDADDLMDEMIEVAKKMGNELGKAEGLTENESEILFRQIGLAALKYFILKVDPKKNMMFNPEESIDFNGNTGPFIQYTYARIQSVLRKAKENDLTDIGYPSDTSINNKEKDILKLIYEYPKIIKEAGDTYSPALIANFVYELAKEYNQFYHDYPILKEEFGNVRSLRIAISEKTGNIIKSAMHLLGIEVPERM